MEERFYKKIYSHGDFYRALLLTIRSTKHLRLNRRQKLLSVKFRERIMLAVTEVNGCAACSYAHTRLALEEGMSPEEIEALLSGDRGYIPEEELVAILYAQHYTDNNGSSSKESWLRLVDEYSLDKAWVVLAVIRMITVGNIYGIAISAIIDRFKGKPSGKTSLFYELSLIISVLFYIPIVLVHAIFDNFRKKTLLPFDH
ncbi:MAG: carboxymuconolactone decarboxylase family protein [Deltaproteobacteria bacterium]|jgi:AhpD family alkylhydroperoxidase|nr:carboxymuconolactone decarboxylase family protein [Deltaproteobacteria bacterium]